MIDAKALQPGELCAAAALLHVRAERMFPAREAALVRASAGTFVAIELAVMGRIELANSIAAAAREAQQRGEHKEAAELFARALRVLTESRASSRVSDLWEQIRTHPPQKMPEIPLQADGWMHRYLRQPK
jgi:hypothetical protein